MAVVADGYSDSPRSRVVDGRASVAGCVVRLLVEAGVVRDVDHPRDAEQAAVGVEDRRAVVGSPVVAQLVHVEDGDERELSGPRCHGFGQRTGHGFRQVGRGRIIRSLRKEAVDGELGERDDLGAHLGSDPHRLQGSIQVLPSIGLRLVLNQRDPGHARLPLRSLRFIETSCDRQNRGRPPPLGRPAPIGGAEPPS